MVMASTAIFPTPSHIKIEALDLDGVRQTYEFDDFDARVMCHEYDHLEGILYTDKATNVREAIEEADEEGVPSDEKKQDGSN